MMKRIMIIMCLLLSTIPSTSQVQHGKASYYAHQFHNRKMANGQRFDMNKLTCAHKTLPFGTTVKVTNTKNNKSVLLTVTDRGPFVKGRIVDVSLKAAKELDFVQSGVANVILEVIKKKDPAIIKQEYEEYRVIDGTFSVDSAYWFKLPSGKHVIDSIKIK